MGTEIREKELFLCVYNKLYSYFGPRDWWPADTNFEVCVGAILTQGVSWKNVEKAISNLKQAGLLSAEGIVDTDSNTLAELIRPTLYYNQKVRKLKGFCSHLIKEYNGDLETLLAKETSSLRSELLSLWGIGLETADSILLYAGGHRVFVIDNYTKRLFFRLGVWKEDVSYDEMQNRLTSNIPQDVSLYNEYHALIVVHGKDMCMAKRPKCEQCPIKQYCYEQYSLECRD